MEILKAKNISKRIFERLHNKSGFYEGVTRKYADVTNHRFQHDVAVVIKNMSSYTNRTQSLSTYVVQRLRSYGRFNEWWANVSDANKKQIIREIEDEINGQLNLKGEGDGKVWIVVLQKGKHYHPRQDLEVKTSYQAAIDLATERAVKYPGNEYVIFESVARVEPVAQVRVKKL